MPRFLLRIEGVNLASCIDDTDDLSTRRGGGLMLLDAVTQFEEMMPAVHKLERIAVGASIGHYVCEADSVEQIEAVAEAHFRHGSLEYPNRDDSTKTEHLPLRHATFVADAVPLDGTTEKRAADLAHAKNRWRQMQQPSLSLDGVWEPNGGRPCYLNGVRPATTEVHKDGRQPASDSVARRRAYGQDAKKQQFYRAEAPAAAAGLTFTNEFRELTERGTVASDRIDSIPANTDDKIAVLYLDGNKFGESAGRAWDRGIRGYREWSEALRGHHQDLLGKLLTRAAADPTWRVGDATEVRLETLLWGGDDILWVVPAWKGWEVVRWFFEQDHVIRLSDRVQPVYYRCGLVFCRTKAPITNVRLLADALCGHAKKYQPGEDVHRLAYEILESFDDVQGDLDGHRQKWLPLVWAPEAMLFNPGIVKDLWSNVRTVAASADFPIRQLYRYCREWRRPVVDGTDEERKKDGQHRAAEMTNSLKRLKASAAGAAFEAFIARFASPEIGCLHLLQMLPYIPTAEGVPA